MKKTLSTLCALAVAGLVTPNNANADLTLGSPSTTVRNGAGYYYMRDHDSSTKWRWLRTLETAESYTNAANATLTLPINALTYVHRGIHSSNAQESPTNTALTQDEMKTPGCVWRVECRGQFDDDHATGYGLFHNEYIIKSLGYTSSGMYLSQVTTNNIGFASTMYSGDQTFYITQSDWGDQYYNIVTKNNVNTTTTGSVEGNEQTRPARRFYSGYERIKANDTFSNRLRIKSEGDAQEWRFEFEFIPIPDEMLPWAKFVEAANDAKNLKQGTTPGFVSAAAWTDLQNYLTGLGDMKYDDTKTAEYYNDKYAEVKAKVTESMVKIDGLYQIYTGNTNAATETDGSAWKYRSYWRHDATNVNWSNSTTEDYTQDKYIWQVVPVDIVNETYKIYTINGKRFYDKKNYGYKMVGASSETSNVRGNLAIVNESDIPAGKPATQTIRHAGQNGSNAKFMVYNTGDPWMFCKGSTGITTNCCQTGSGNDHTQFIPAGTILKMTQVGDKSWATMWLPVAVDIPTHVKVYRVASVDDAKSKVMLEEVTEILPANTGVIVCSDNCDEEVVFKKTSAEDNDIPVVTSLLMGYDIDKALAADDRVLGADNGIGLYRLNSGDKLPAYKAYIPGSLFADSGTESFGFEIGGATAINTVEMMNEAKKTYDLQGRVVENPSRGIYIRGGKKIFIK